MPLGIPKEKPGSGKTFELCPAGTHAARCYSIVDFGSHLNTFDIEKTSFDHHVCFTWELDVPMADGRPFVISEWRKFRIPKTGWNEKSKLCQALSSWLGGIKELPSFKDLVGKTGMVTVNHNKNQAGDKTFANFASIVPLPGKLPAPDATNEPVYYELDMGFGDAFLALPEWQQNIIKDSREYKKANPESSSTSAPDDDMGIPF